MSPEQCGRSGSWPASTEAGVERGSKNASRPIRWSRAISTSTPRSSNAGPAGGLERLAAVPRRRYARQRLLPAQSEPARRPARPCARGTRLVSLRSIKSYVSGRPVALPDTICSSCTFRVSTRAGTAQHLLGLSDARRLVRRVVCQRHGELVHLEGTVSIDLKELVDARFREPNDRSSPGAWGRHVVAPCAVPERSH